jgi:hypothetical protein
LTLEKKTNSTPLFVSPAQGESRYLASFRGDDGQRAGGHGQRLQVFGAGKDLSLSHDSAGAI